LFFKVFRVFLYLNNLTAFMNIKFFLLPLLVLLTIFSNQVSSQNDDKRSDVYFTEDISPEGVMKLFTYFKDSVRGNVGIKVHFGEDGNAYYLPATLVEPLCKELNATLIETNVAYKGRRHETTTHKELAKDHGFTFAPIDILDDGGTLMLPIEGSTWFDSARIGKNIENYETIIYFTHFKGHGSAGFGGCIKNVSMGMATIEGKKLMHFNNFPKTDNSKCTRCGVCVADCPSGAITLNPLTIDKEKCIGCGKCISSCHFDAISNPEAADKTQRFLEGLVEYAKPVCEMKNSLYFNVIMNVSPSCDCSGNPKKPFVSDIGILISTDIVAIETAAHDLVDKAHKCDDAFLKANSVSGKHQIEYAAKMGMGNKKYRLINIDK